VSELVVTEPQKLPIIRNSVPAMSLNEMRAFAGDLIPTGMLPASIKTPGQAMAIMLRGRELGIGPMEALMSIDVINGKVRSSTQLMLALIYRSRLAENIEFEYGDPAKVTVKRVGMPALTVSFSTDDAKRAGLMSKDNWRKWPATMCMWRAITIAARLAFPDVIGAVYTSDEIGVEMRSDEMVDAKAQWHEETVKPFGFLEHNKPESANDVSEVENMALSGYDACVISTTTGVPLPVVTSIIAGLNIENGEVGGEQQDESR